MLIKEKCTCYVCQQEFEGINPFSHYVCEGCNKRFVLCNSCYTKFKKCDSCGGEVVSLDTHIQRHGITDIYGNHHEPEGRIMY